MDLKLSISVIYALKALSYIIKENVLSKPIMVREIAHQCELPYDSTMRIMRQLTKSQLLKAHRGSKGGFTFRKMPQDITFLEIIEAIDGPVEINDSLVTSNHSTKLEQIASKLLSKAKVDLEARIGGVTLSQMV